MLLVVKENVNGINLTRKAINLNLNSIVTMEREYLKIRESVGSFFITATFQTGDERTVLTEDLKNGEIGKITTSLLCKYKDKMHLAENDSILSQCTLAWDLLFDEIVDKLAANCDVMIIKISGKSYTRKID